MILIEDPERFTKIDAFRGKYNLVIETRVLTHDDGHSD